MMAALGRVAKTQMLRNAARSGPTAFTNPFQYLLQCHVCRFSGDAKVSDTLESSEGVSIYASPFFKLVRRLKRVSVFGASVSILAVPLLVACANEHWSLAQSGVVSGASMLGGVSTTVVLHYALRGYVTDMRMHSTDCVEFHTLSLFGNRKTFTVNPSLLEEGSLGRLWCGQHKRSFIIHDPLLVKAAREYPELKQAFAHVVDWEEAERMFAEQEKAMEGIEDMED